MNNYHYDNYIDAMMLEANNYNYKESYELTDEIIIDYNQDNEIIGIEILNASQVLQIDKRYLVNPEKVTAKISINKEKIEIIITFHKKEEKKIINNIIKGVMPFKALTTILIA